MSWSHYKERFHDESTGDFLGSLQASRVLEREQRLPTPVMNTPSRGDSDVDDSRINMSDLPSRPSAPAFPGNSFINEHSSHATHHEPTLRLRSSLALDPEFSFLSAATRLSTVRPTTYHDSDWVTEPDTNVGNSPYGVPTTTIGAGYHRPNRLAPKIADGQARGRRRENVPPVPPVHAKYRGQLTIPVVQQARPFSFVNEGHDELDVPMQTIRIIQSDLSLPKPAKQVGSIGFPAIARRQELTYPNLAPEDLNIVKSQEGSLTSVKTLSNNITVLRPHQDQRGRPADGHARHQEMDTVVLDVETTCDFDNTAMAQADVSNDTVVIRIDRPPTVAKDPIKDPMRKFKRPFRSAKIAIPTSTSSIPGKATQSPMMGMSTEAGGCSMSSEELGGEEFGVIAGVKRMISRGQNGRVMDWLGSVRSRTGRSWHEGRAEVPILDEPHPRTMPPEMPPRPNGFVTQTSRDQIFGSQQLSELALSSRSYILPGNPFMYTKATRRVGVLYRVVLAMIFVPVVGFVVGTVAVKGGLDGVVYRVAKREMAGFTERQRTVMQRVMWWLLVWLMALGAFAIMGVLYLKG